jgi:hypothetical protein
VVGSLPLGFPTLRQAAQEDPRPVFQLVDREQLRQFGGLLSPRFSSPLRASHIPSKIDALQQLVLLSITYKYSAHSAREKIIHLFLKYFKRLTWEEFIPRGAISGGTSVPGSTKADRRMSIPTQSGRHPGVDSPTDPM